MPLQVPLVTAQPSIDSIVILLPTIEIRILKYYEWFIQLHVGDVMSRLALSVNWPARRNISHHQIFRAYSLTHQAAERIRGQLIQSQARLITPENSQSTTIYKGLLIIIAGPFAKFPRLKQYSDPYLQEGFAAINILHSKIDFASCTFSDYKIDGIFNVLSSVITDSCPIVVKLYCGGSMSYLPPIMRRVSQSDCNLRIAGIIFDSAPVYYNWTTAWNVYRMFDDLAPHLNRFQKIRGALFTGIFGLISRKNKHRYFERFAFNPNSILCTIPQLYIYSPVDYVPVLSYLQKVINEQKKYGADVTTKIFPDTLHIVHRKKYPEEYDNTVLQFLTEKCLR